MQNSLWMKVDYTSATEQCPNVFKLLYTGIYIFFVNFSLLYCGNINIPR